MNANEELRKLTTLLLINKDYLYTIRRINTWKGIFVNEENIGYHN